METSDRAQVRPGAKERVGVVTVPAEVTDAVMPGVASLPHGYGHARPGVGQRLAASRPGASLNDLTDPERLDELTGNAALSGVPIVVRRADERARERLQARLPALFPSR